MFKWLRNRKIERYAQYYALNVDDVSRVVNYKIAQLSSKFCYLSFEGKVALVNDSRQQKLAKIVKYLRDHVPSAYLFSVYDLDLLEHPGHGQCCVCLEHFKQPSRCEKCR